MPYHSDSTKLPRWRPATWPTTPLLTPRMSPGPSPETRQPAARRCDQCAGRTEPVRRACAALVSFSVCDPLPPLALVRVRGIAVDFVIFCTTTRIHGHMVHENAGVRAWYGDYFTSLRAYQAVITLAFWVVLCPAHGVVCYIILFVIH